MNKSLDIEATEAETPDRAGTLLLGRLPKARVPRVLLAVVLLLGAVAAYLFWVNRSNDDLAEDAAQARVVGTAHVEELLSYDYQSMDEELQRERDWLTTGFQDEYTPLISDTFAPQAKKAELVTQATVVAAGVEQVDGDRVELIVFANVAVQQKGAAPSLTGSRLRVTLERSDGDWLISALDPI